MHVPVLAQILVELFAAQLYLMVGQHTAAEEHLQKGVSILIAAKQQCPADQEHLRQLEVQMEILQLLHCLALGNTASLQDSGPLQSLTPPCSSVVVRLRPSDCPKQAICCDFASPSSKCCEHGWPSVSFGAPSALPAV